MFDLEKKLIEWRNYLMGKGNFLKSDIEELEGHLREEVDDLKGRGLDEEEALLIGVKRLGNAEAISKEYSKVNTENLWKQLMVKIQDPGLRRRARTELIIICFLTAFAGLSALLPTLFGYTLSGDRTVIYAKQVGFFFIPMISVYFIWKKM